jgi:hypothetical protein
MVYRTASMASRFDLRRAVAVVGLAGALAACTSSTPTTDRELNRLDAAPLCCTDSSRIPIPGSLQSELRVSLDAASPVFLFASGRSPAYGFELPDLGEPYQIEMRALPRGGVNFGPTGNFARLYVFPAMLFLDDKRAPLADEYSNELVAQCVGLGCDYALRSRVPVPAGARYAVLHTTYAKIGQFYSAIPALRSSDPDGDGKSLVYIGASRQVFAQFAASGTVLVNVRKFPPPPKNPGGDAAKSDR